MTARFGEDLQSLTEGMANVVVRLGTPSSFRALESEADALARLPNRPRVRLVLGQPPQRPNVGAAVVRLLRDRLDPRPGRGVAAPARGALRRLDGRAPWGWQSAAIRRAFDAAAPLLARDGRAVLLLEPGGPEGLVAAALGGVACRLSAGGCATGRARRGDRRDRRVRAARRAGPGRAADPGQRQAAGRPRAAPATPTWSRAAACSRHPSGSIAGRFVRGRRRADRHRRPPSRSSRRAASRPATSGCSARSSSASIEPVTSGGSSPRAVVRRWGRHRRARRPDRGLARRDGRAAAEPDPAAGDRSAGRPAATSGSSADADRPAVGDAPAGEPRTAARRLEPRPASVARPPRSPATRSSGCSA